MKSVVLCCSKRFKSQAYAFMDKLEKKGVIVYRPPLYEWTENLHEKLDDCQVKVIATGLTLNHFKRIEEADVVFVYNKNGYIGNSLTLEIGYSVACRKPIYALENDPNEVCRDILFTDICKTANALLKKLV